MRQPYSVVGSAGGGAIVRKKEKETDEVARTTYESVESSRETTPPTRATFGCRGNEGPPLSLSFVTLSCSRVNGRASTAPTPSLSLSLSLSLSSPSP